MSILDRLNDDDLDRIYTLLQAYAAAPDSLSTYRNFMAQARFGHTSIRFGGELLGWYGAIYFGDNHFCIPEVDGMSRKQERIAHQTNIELSKLRDELLPRRPRSPSIEDTFEDEVPSINICTDSTPEEDEPKPNSLMSCPLCGTKIVYNPSYTDFVCPTCNAYILLEDQESDDAIKIHVFKSKG